MLQGAALVLAARMILLLAVTGGFIIAWRVLSGPSMMALAVLALYVLGVLFPVAVLAGRK